MRQIGRFKPVDLNEWELIKSFLKRHHNNVDTVKQLTKRSYSTIGRVQASKTYDHYKDLVTKERVPRKPGTLREDIDDHERRLSLIESHLGFDKDGCEG